MVDRKEGSNNLRFVQSRESSHTRGSLVRLTQARPPLYPVATPEEEELTRKRIDRCQADWLREVGLANQHAEHARASLGSTGRPKRSNRFHLMD